ncbi:MAG: hypothetical protein ACW99R_12160, partial [Candidatus Hodarchaeales archaeon]
MIIVGFYILGIVSLKIKLVYSNEKTLYNVSQRMKGAEHSLDKVCFCSLPFSLSYPRFRRYITITPRE